MNALNLKGDKCKIMFFDDSAKKEGYNVVVNIGGGPKMVARAKKGEKLKNFFQRLNLNVTNMFFLKNANIVDPEQRVSDLTNKQDKIDKSLQVVGIQNNENNDDENNPNENNNEEDNDQNKDNGNNNTNEKLPDIPKEKLADIPNEKIADIPNEKIADNNLNENLVIEKQNEANEEVEENSNKKKEETHIYIVPEEDIRVYIRNSYFFIILQYAFIILFVWLGCKYNINDKFNASKGTMLGTFIPITFAGGLIILLISVCFEEKDFGSIKQTIFFILFVAIITFECFLLSYFTDYIFIVWILIAFVINYVICLIYLMFFNYRYCFIFPLQLIINTIIAIVTYYFILDMTNINIINGSAVLFSFIIYNIIAIIFVKYMKSSVESEIDVLNWKSIYLSLAINYGIFSPIPILLISLLFLIVYCCDKCSSNGCCDYCCDCCDCCDCYYCCDCCDCC